MGSIVVSLPCTAYLWAALIAFCKACISSIHRVHPLLFIFTFSHLLISLQLSLIQLHAIFEAEIKCIADQCMADGNL